MSSSIKAFLLLAWVLAVGIVVGTASALDTANAESTAAEVAAEATNGSSIGK